MADNETITSPELANGSADGVTLSDRRLMIALEAVWEADAIALELPHLVPRSCNDLEGQLMHARLLLRTLSARLRTCASVLMSALQDEVETDATLEGKLCIDHEGLPAASGALRGRV